MKKTVIITLLFSFLFGGCVSLDLGVRIGKKTVPLISFDLCKPEPEKLMEINK